MKNTLASSRISFFLNWNFRYANFLKGSNLKRFIFLILLLFYYFTANCQTIYPDYRDGSIFVKVKNLDTTQIPFYDTTMNINNFDSTYQSLIAIFDIQKIEKAFQTTNEISIDKVYKVSFANTSFVDSIIKTFKLLNYVHYAEKVPLDVLYCTAEYNNWNLANFLEYDHLDKVSACTAWGFYTGTPSARRIAITDSEFDVNHPDLSAKLALNPFPCSTNVWDVTDNDNNVAGPGTFDHGTHVAGIAGASTNNVNGGVASLSFDVPIILVKVAHDNYGQVITHGYDGIIWAVNNCADIINVSWGSSGYSIANESVIQWAFSQNKIIVAAAGNENNSQFHYPAAYPNVLAVANTDNFDAKQINSCYGTWVDVSAPGTDIYSTLPSAIYGPNAYGNKTGTSMSAPLVSALCGLIWTSTGAIANNYTNQMVINCIKSTTDNIYLPNLNQNYLGLLGTGRINALSALLCAQNPGVDVAFNQNHGVICAGSAINFTDASIVNGGIITSYNWSFPGGTPNTSNLANPIINYNSSGVFSVTLTITVNGQQYSFTNSNCVTVIGVESVIPAINIPICKGEEMQFVVTAGGNNNNNNQINYSVNGNGPFNEQSTTPVFSIYFDTDPILNTTLHIINIIGFDPIANTQLTCPINENILVSTVDCCPNNLTTNADFNSGWSNFTTEQAQVIPFFLVPGNANVENGFPSWVDINRGNSLMIDGRALSCGPFPCQPLANNLSPFPTVTELCCGSNGFFPNQFSILWRQGNISLSNEMNYKLTFFTTHGNNQLAGGVQPLQLRVRILDASNNTIFSGSPNIVPTYGYKEWYLYGVDIPYTAIPTTANNYKLSIEQFEYFQNLQFDFLLDEIHLYRYLPLDLTTNLPGNNLQGGLNVGIITANSPQMYTNYAWAGPSGTPVFNTLTNVTVPGIYTCTATDAGGCTRTSTIEIFDFCSPPFPAFTWELSVNTGNNNSTNVINNLNLGSSIVTTNAPIYITGIFTVDQNISFVNCPNIFLDAYAEIVLLNGATLTIDGSHLSSACNTMWNGIKADHVSESIVINNSTLRDMYWGVDATNGAPINCQGSTFTDNNVGIRIITSPVGYNHDNGNCVIRMNHFNSSGNSLLIPLQSQNKGEIGIYLEKCREVEIGYIDIITPNPNEKNIFEDLYTGIYSIQLQTATAVQELKIKNNDYLNIKDDIFQGLWPQWHIITNCYGTRRGAGIYFDGFDPLPSPGSYPGIYHSGHILHVKDGGKFENCDKAIVGHFINAEIKNVGISSTLMGFMFTNADKQFYFIGDDFAPGLPPDGTNKMHEVFIGTQLIGNVSEKSFINANEYDLFNGGILNGYNASQAWPVGIDLKEYANPGEEVLISSNKVSIPNQSGTGIRLTSTGKKLKCELNYIDFSTNYSGIFGGFGIPPELIGIQIENCVKSTIVGNHVDGHLMSLGAYNARLASGIKMRLSTNLHLECNHLRDTRYGMWVNDACGTANNTTMGVVNNSFNNHNHAIFFTYGANEATLNDIGTTTLDYGNSFANTDVSKPYTTGHRLFRVAMNQGFNNNIYSNNLANLESWSDWGGNSRYIPVNPITSTVPPCQPPYNLISNEDSTVNEEFAEDVIFDSLESFSFPEMATYLNDRTVFTQLDEDSVARAGNMLYNVFYNSLVDSTLGKLQKVDVILKQMISADSLTYAQSLQNAQTANNNINVANSFQQNEIDINNIYLTYQQYGWDGLSNPQKVAIEMLAKSCIYTHGIGVFKARTLWANAEPGLDYDDLYICTQGNNKMDVFGSIKDYLNGNNNGDENNLTKATVQEAIWFFPNPTSDRLNIIQNISDKGNIQMELIDNIGRIVKKESLAGNISSVFFDVNNLPAGIYICKVSINKAQAYFGKITIIK